MATYKTPGVYVEEISTLPPSVAEVSTAIPAFIGYTEKGRGVGRIGTLLEYEATFGGAKPSGFSVRTSVDPATGARTVAEIKHAAPDAAPDFLMYYCVSHYFKNGGGACYIVSIGNYDSQPAAADFDAGLALLEKEDEPTLILLTDAVNLDSAAYYSLCQDALAQCQKLGDRFAILDVLDGDNKVEEFRDQIGTNALMYGAAYYPYLQTTLNYRYREGDVDIPLSVEAPTSQPTWEGSFGGDGIVVTYTGSAGAAPTVKFVKGSVTDPLSFTVLDADTLEIRNVGDRTGQDVATAWAEWSSGAGNDPKGFKITAKSGGSGADWDWGTKSLSPKAADEASNTLASIKSDETGLYNAIKAALSGERVVLPPSAAMAGIYARVDRQRGVWKAPANVSVSSVLGPVTKITHDDQEGLNVDPTAGKSINAIRAFTGKGTLVWGARTLAGNDNEWRYVSVRRLFNLIEESTQKATAFAVFEPNDATTWLKVKGMIESYLYGLWERGALAGPTPEAAYFVNVGLGKTMTPQDVLEGRMIVEMGIAAVRPAEFIILRFTHKMQEA